MSSKAVILVPFGVLGVLAVFFTLGYLITTSFGITQQFGFPPAVRFLGAILLLSGFVLFIWLFKYRRPMDILTSTFVTFTKVGKERAYLGERSGRTESLVVKGPYRYVRHPLYFDVLVLLLGWWLLLDYSFLLISDLLLLPWFNFVVASFEEKELRAIFGADYEEYAKRVPKIIPFTSQLGEVFKEPDS
jgi:protein-S-isoprenylcysteine O-methyltransferase Ste14